MTFIAQCWTCGESVRFVSPVVRPGNYPCPLCQEGLVNVPVTPLTQMELDPCEITEFEVLGVQAD